MKAVLLTQLKNRAANRALDNAESGVANTVQRFWESIFGTGHETESIYDCVIRMDSLWELKESGWPLMFKSEDAIDKLCVQQDAFLTVSMLGSYNQGKTHVVNKLLAANYKAGMLTHTQGLSITLPRKDGNNWLIVDSAGSNQPVQTD